MNALKDNFLRTIDYLRLSVEVKPKEHDIKHNMLIDNTPDPLLLTPHHAKRPMSKIGG